MELGGLGNGLFDTISVSGGATFNLAGTLDLDFYGIFDGTGLKAGDYFDLIHADGSSYLTGKFDVLDLSGALLGGSFFWELDYLFEDFSEASFGDEHSYVRLSAGYSASPVPEPATPSLLGIGLAGSLSWPAGVGDGLLKGLRRQLLSRREQLLGIEWLDHPGPCTKFPRLLDELWASLRC